MSGSTFGSVFQLSTFGESHGQAMGGIIHGCPAGVSLNLEHIQGALNRRRPGQSAVVSPRNEADEIEFLSGIFQGKLPVLPLVLLLKTRINGPKIMNSYPPFIDHRTLI